MHYTGIGLLTDSSIFMSICTSLSACEVFQVVVFSLLAGPYCLRDIIMKATVQRQSSNVVAIDVLRIIAPVDNYTDRHFIELPNK